MQPVREQHLESFLKLVAEMQTIDEDFSFGAGLARFLEDRIREETGLEFEDGAALPEKVRPTIEQRSEAIFKGHAACLAAIGLELVVNRGRLEMRSLALRDDLQLPCDLTPQESVLGGGKIEFGLVDGERLVAFLRSITPAQAGRVEADAALRFLAESLDRELLGRYLLYCVGQGADDWPAFTDALGQVTSELQRLDQQESAALMAVHLERVWQGDLTEYILAEEAHLINHGFGPHNWHLDAPSEAYERYWNKALDVVEYMGNNPKAAALAGSITAHLRESAETAKREIEEKLGGAGAERSYWQRFGPAQLETLDRVCARLALYE